MTPSGGENIETAKLSAASTHNGCLGVPWSIASMRSTTLLNKRSKIIVVPPSQFAHLFRISAKFGRHRTKVGRFSGNSMVEVGKIRVRCLMSSGQFWSSFVHCWTAPVQFLPKSGQIWALPGRSLPIFENVHGPRSGTRGKRRGEARWSVEMSTSGPRSPRRSMLTMPEHLQRRNARPQQRARCRGRCAISLGGCCKTTMSKCGRWGSDDPYVLSSPRAVATGLPIRTHGALASHVRQQIS